MNINLRINEASGMKAISKCFFKDALSDQRGQVLPWAAFAMVGLLGVAGLTIDAGRAYVVRGQLQNSTNAAALAAAGEVYNNSSSDNATNTAKIYSSAATGNQNFDAGLGTVTPTVTTKCLNMLMPSKTGCPGAPDNAIVVKQSVSVPTYFMKLFGFKSLTVSATATASMQGIAQPWNVAIVVDSTGSMNTKDTNCGGVTEFQCALSGIQGLLAATNPACPPGSSKCPTGANFRVSLFTFPNISTDTVRDDIDCNGNPGSQGHPTAEPYTLPLEGASSYTPLTYTPTGKDSKGKPLPPWTATYQITPFLSDYYQPSSSDGLNHGSDLVKAVGYGGPAATLGCLTYTAGIINSGINNTYFAGAIYAAQAALVAQQAANPESKNALIFLSDGQANIDNTQLPSAAAGTGRVGPSQPWYATPATTPASAGYSAAQVNGKGLYPDGTDDCQQAIVAAKLATNAGTTVYSVAYGAEQSGCNNTTDKTLVIHTGAYNVPVTLNTLLPCVTMEDIASSLPTFYSDYLQSGGQASNSCVDASHTVVSLSGIFQSIAASFTTPRLLPNDAT